MTDDERAEALRVAKAYASDDPSLYDATTTTVAERAYNHATAAKLIARALIATYEPFDRLQAVNAYDLEHGVTSSLTAERDEAVKNWKHYVECTTKAEAERDAARCEVERLAPLVNAARHVAKLYDGPATESQLRQGVIDLADVAHALATAESEVAGG